jgi:hypothetical protein
MTSPVVTRSQVVVTDIDIPFGSMVVLIIKWAIASIPALILLSILGAIVGILVGGVFSAMFGSLLPRWPTT